MFEARAERLRENDSKLVTTYLKKQGISTLLSKHYIYNAKSSTAPILLKDKVLCHQLRSVLLEIGIK